MKAHAATALLVLATAICATGPASADEDPMVPAPIPHLWATNYNGWCNGQLADIDHAVNILPSGAESGVAADPGWNDYGFFELDTYDEDTGVYSYYILGYAEDAVCDVVSSVSAAAAECARQLVALFDAGKAFDDQAACDPVHG